MNKIETYSQQPAVEKKANYTKMSENAIKVKKFAEYLYNFREVLREEFEELDSLNERKPNDVFPIKMRALSDIYQASEPLYEWYVAKAKK